MRRMTMPCIKTGIKALLVLSLALLVFAGCKPRVKTPDDFARLTEPGYNFKYRAISSDEVTIAVKKRKNNPRGDVKFWAKVMKEKVPLVYGYTFKKDEDITTGNGVKGKLVEFEVEQEEGKYIYMLGVFVKGKKMWIFEAGGKEEAFKSKRSVVVRTIKSMNI